MRLEPSTDIQHLTSLLKDADEDTGRMIATIEDGEHMAYLAVDDERIVGAVVMHWHPAESEIVYIAMDEVYRGQGYGKACIAQLVHEAHKRQVESLIVGTANSSLGNMAFYQKCGFRMDSVRKDFFDYLPEPVYEAGIQIRDMVVLRMAIA